MGDVRRHPNSPQLSSQEEECCTLTNIHISGRLGLEMLDLSHWFQAHGYDATLSIGRAASNGYAPPGPNEALALLSRKHATLSLQVSADSISSSWWSCLTVVHNLDGCQA